MVIWDELGQMIVSDMEQGLVLGLPDRDHNGVADEVITILSGLNKPHGLEMNCENGCRLFVAENHQVSMYDYTPQIMTAFNAKKLVNLPAGGRHEHRSLLFKRDSANQLFVSVPSTCNACYEPEERNASLLLIDIENRVFTGYASGLRDTSFLAYHPNTHQLWGTEIGREFLPDDLPPNEINIIKQGANYGWPQCFGNNQIDFDFLKRYQFDTHPCDEIQAQPNHINLLPYANPMGLVFLPSYSNLPKEYQDDLLVAYHGSWLQDDPVGFKVTRLELDRLGNYLVEKDFITGWLRSDGTSIGRPVDIKFGPDGALYITDDEAGQIYRMIYTSN
ncbi:PQQ-dependent sugar dehydrogenase [Candidatus Peregrinibacteria bacterium]|nr:MAG: PQQ-dependent sugar dehydrogenase [Candidatus Peregrinibacteria bacterium]